VLNGQVLAGHVGGYLPFSAEITDQLSASSNVLAISRIRTSTSTCAGSSRAVRPPSIDYWEPGGLCRDVQLRVVPQAYIFDVFAKPWNVLQRRPAAGSGAVHRGRGGRTQRARDHHRRTAGRHCRDLLRFGPATISQTGQVTVDRHRCLTWAGGVTLWDIDNPKLYTVRATLQVDGTPAA